MILLDANVLLYAYDARSPRHLKAKAWLEKTFSGTDSVFLSWTTLLAFVRIVTHPRVFQSPLSLEAAILCVDGWLERPCVQVLQCGDDHWKIFCRVALGGQVRGPMIMDAHLAALAVEHGMTLVTTDRDFARFEGLRFKDPL